MVERQNEMEKMISRRTRERQHSFLRQGNQSQYDFTDTVRGQVQDALSDLERGGSEETAIFSLQKAVEMLERRMRLTKMADRSEYGWAVVAEYEADELAVDSDDEKRIYRAEKKWLKKRKRQDDQVDGARGGTGTTQPRATANIGASLRAGPCFGCGEWGHLKRNCPRSVRGAMPPNHSLSACAYTPHIACCCLMYHLPWWSDCCSFKKKKKKFEPVGYGAIVAWWYGAIVAWCVMGPQWPVLFGVGP